MKPVRRNLEATERLRIAFELFEAAEAIMRQNLRRRHPEADDEEIERRLAAWLHHRPGAEYGDAPGRLVPLEQYLL